MQCRNEVKEGAETDKVWRLLCDRVTGRSDQRSLNPPRPLPRTDRPARDVTFFVIGFATVHFVRYVMLFFLIYFAFTFFNEFVAIVISFE